jgi:formylglycine-generating enzyme required for sulfatase activity
VSVLGYTTGYAPFEQIQGQGTDARSDLFSLAATLYHLLVGMPPPDAMVRALSTMNGQADPLRPVHAVNAAVPPALGAVVQQALAMGRDQRPESAVAMRAALKSAAAESVAAAPAPMASGAEAATVAVPRPAGDPAVAARPAPRSGMRLWLVGAGVAGLVVVIGLTVALPGRRITSPNARPEAAHEVVADLIAIAPAERTFAFEAATPGPDGAVARDQRQGRSYFEDLGNDEAIEMVAIPSGEFLMGSTAPEYPDEGPQHRVTILPLYLSRYEVTQAQWRAVATTMPRVAHDLDPEPAAFKGDALPVEQVSWDDAIEFCERLSRKTRRRYRLPSEAEWEYAARAGTATAFAFGDTLTPTLANYDGEVAFGSGPRGAKSKGTVPVGSFGVANAFGLYDMHGNVMEWCLGEYHSNYEGAPPDGRPWLANGDLDRRVLRGGSWDDLAVDCRSANRYSYPREGRQRTIGLRLAMSLPPPTGPTRMADPVVPDVTTPTTPRERVVDGQGPRRLERPLARRLRPKLRQTPGD